MKVLVGALSVVVILVAGVLIAVYSGMYNIAATNAHTGGLLEWTLQTAMKNSVRRYAAATVDSPPESINVTRKTAQSYSEMCVRCHGAPGVTPGETGKGLMPPAPNLVRAATVWSTPELFWIIKNGVQFTGMPAWGNSHGDTELWELAFLVKRFPEMSAEQFRALLGADVGSMHRH